MILNYRNIREIKRCSFLFSLIHFIFNLPKQSNYLTPEIYRKFQIDIKYIRISNYLEICLIQVQGAIFG